MSEQMASSARQSWIVSLSVRDDDGIRHDWTYDSGGVPDSVTGAIDTALRVCDEEVVGLNYVQKTVKTHDS